MADPIAHKHSRGATGPDLLIQCLYTNGDIQPLTGASAVFVYAPSEGGSEPEDGGTENTIAATVTDATNGYVAVPWGSPLIDTARFYVAQVHVTIGSELIKFPEPGTYIKLEITPSLGN